MSSRSLAAARARRAGDSAPPVSGNRPGTSIGSHAAFAQQHQMGPPPPNNVRVARSQQQQPPQYAQQQQNSQYYDQPPVNQKSNGLPFNKISVSDAIGLITLRLGRVEQWIIETDHENEVNGSSGNQNGMNIPDNHKIIDSSVLTTIINRLDSLEKNSSSVLSGSTVSSEQMSELKENVTKLTEQLSNVGDEVAKHRIELAKQTEQVFRFNRELTETKDILKSFMVKYDMFTQEMTNNLSDYETALSELEKRLPTLEDNNEAEENENRDGDGDEAKEEGTSLTDIDDSVDNKIMSVDLKNIIKQELANA